MRVTKRVEIYIRKQLDAKVEELTKEPRAKREELSELKRAEKEKSKEIQRKIIAELNAKLRELAKEYGLVLKPYYAGSPNDYNFSVELSLYNNGGFNTNDAFVTEEWARLDSKEAELDESIVRYNTYDMTNKICLELEMGGKKLSDLDEILANVKFEEEK